jgi:hypothetical protein
MAFQSHHRRASIDLNTHDLVLDQRSFTKSPKTPGIQISISIIIALQIFPLAGPAKPKLMRYKSLTHPRKLSRLKRILMMVCQRALGWMYLTIQAT